MTMAGMIVKKIENDMNCMETNTAMENIGMLGQYIYPKTLKISTQQNWLWVNFIKVKAMWFGCFKMQMEDISLTTKYMEELPEQIEF